MKVFIVFLGLLIANVTFITYQGDLARYLRLQDFLKATAEECACGAAEYYDEEAFSRGEMLVDAVEAEKYVKYIISFQYKYNSNHRTYHLLLFLLLIYLFYRY